MTFKINNLQKVIPLRGLGFVHVCSVFSTYSLTRWAIFFIDERAYIKMLAAKAHMNLSEFILSYLRKDFPENTPNKETLEAMNECEEGRGIKCESIEDFWEKMGMNTPEDH